MINPPVFTLNTDWCVAGRIGDNDFGDSLSNFRDINAQKSINVHKMLITVK